MTSPKSRNEFVKDKARSGLGERGALMCVLYGTLIKLEAVWVREGIQCVYLMNNYKARSGLGERGV